jgi:hypothetical protein
MTGHSRELHALAQRIADALPPVAEEIVVTGSVSRGMADELSDVEMLVVTAEQLELAECFELASGAGLANLGTWGRQDVPARRVSGMREGVPIELIWWSRATADQAVDAIFTVEDAGATADALSHGVALRTAGLLAAWQERLDRYPDELANARIEDAALKWGGFAPAGLLTIVRPGERLALLEWLLDDALRVVRILFALNRVWQPTAKRLAARVAELEHAPDRAAERIEEALTEPDPRRALLAMIDLQLETLALAPSSPNVDRARTWLTAGRELLSRG